MLDRKPRPAARRRFPAAGLSALFLALPALFASAPALGQGAITYPSSRSLADIAAWLQRDTPVQLGQVVDVGPSAVTAVTSAAPMGEPRGFLAGVSSEAIDPQILGHEGVASWTIPVEVDCEHRVVRLGAMTGFHSRDLRSDGKIVREADTNFVTPITNAPLGAVVRALCDRDYKRPFAGKKYAVAKPAPTPTGPPPASAPTRVAEAAPPPPALRSTLPPTRPPPPPPKPEAKPAPEPKAEAPRVEPPASKGGGGVAVQIGAGARPDLEAMLAKFKKAHAGDLGGLKSEVVTAQSDGKTVNRALISGFGSATEAGAFCKKLEASGQACFIRR